MPRLARWVMLATLIAVAAWLHLSTCFWGMQKAPRSLGVPLVASGNWQWHQGNDGHLEWRYEGTGLFARRGASLGEAAALGIALPVAMLASCVVLVCVWRRQDRVERGECATCGHPVSGERCSECGAKAR